MKRRGLLKLIAGVPLAVCGLMKASEKPKGTAIDYDMLMKAKKRIENAVPIATRTTIETHSKTRFDVVTCTLHGHDKQWQEVQRIKCRIGKPSMHEGKCYVDLHIDSLRSVRMRSKGIRA